MRFLPIFWIILLGTIGIASGQNLYGWLITGFVAFLIYPSYWDSLEARGKNTRQGIRFALAAIYSVFFAYAGFDSAFGGPEYGSPEYLIAEAQQSVAAKLKDPSSAQFTDVRVSELGTVCGKVNGKNAFGAYAGATRFVNIPVSAKGFNLDTGEMGAFVEGEETILLSSDGPQRIDFLTLYERHCLGISKEQQERERAAFVEKYGEG